MKAYVIGWVLYLHITIVFCLVSRRRDDDGFKTTTATTDLSTAIQAQRTSTQHCMGNPEVTIINRSHHKNPWKVLDVVAQVLRH